MGNEGGLMKDNFTFDMSKASPEIAQSAAISKPMRLGLDYLTNCLSSGTSPDLDYLVKFSYEHRGT